MPEPQNLSGAGSVQYDKECGNDLYKVTPSPYADHDHVSAKAQVAKDNKCGVTARGVTVFRGASRRRE